MASFQQDLGPVKIKRKTGLETFKLAGKSLDITLQEFWRWSTSDLVLNITRGVLAEFIVAKALQAAGAVRTAWDAFDLTTPQGIKVEVKSAAYLQSWSQDTLSRIQFNFKKTTPLDEDKGSYRGKPRRAAAVYVFALLNEKVKRRVDPMNLDQWEFFVVPTRALVKRSRSQQSITLNSLIDEKDKLKMQRVGYAGLRDAVIKAAS